MKQCLAVLCCLSTIGCKKGVDVEAPPPVDDTPVQHSDLPARPPKGCTSHFFSVHYENAHQTLREAEEYKPALRSYYVRQLSDRRNEYLLAGISPSERKAWLGSLFDALGTAAARTLPKYRPRGHVHHDEEELIRDAVKQEVADGEVLALGLQSADWSIEKLANGLPSSRYKHGMAWVKSPRFDDSYCRIAYVNLIQDYSGGGTWASSRAVFITTEPAGCK
jgi:hypothetical protein